MPFNIFKSTFAAAMFLVVPTKAQIGNWDILYQSLTTNFQYTVDNEITLSYRIGKNRAFNVALFDKDCVTPITGMSMIPTTARIPSVTANHDGLTIMLNLDKKAITSSNIWEDNSRLKFCVSVQLLSNGSIIKEDKREIDIAFDFTVDIAANLALQSAYMTSSSGSANVDNYITACKCDDLSTFKCNTLPLTPNNLLYVCITSVNADVEIAFLNSLEMLQGNPLGSQTLSIVDGLMIQNDEIAALTVKNATAIGVATVVPSRFFSFSGASTATISGVVSLKFVGPKRRLSKLENFSFSNVSGSVYARELSDEGGNDVSPFEVSIGIEHLASDVPVVVSASRVSSDGSMAFLSSIEIFLGVATSAVLAFCW